MDWAQVGVQWLHVLLGIFWFGGNLFMNFMVLPTMMRQPLGSTRAFGLALMLRTERVFTIVSGIVILLGILRGTVFGRIHAVSDLGTTYGILWTTGLLAAIAALLWGKYLIGARAVRLYHNDAAWVADGQGRPPAILLTESAGLRRNGLVEQVFFLVVFTCMILMRFN